MFYYTVSKENMHDTDDKPLSLEEFKALVNDFYEAYPVITEHSAEVRNIVIDGDRSSAEVNIDWRGIPKNEKATVKHEGLSKFRLTRSVYGGWDIIQASIPGWLFHKK